VSSEIKEKSILTKEEWKEYFNGHWYFKGEKQAEHEAMFPDELPYRLIKMFSFVGDTILDPFLGSGTTLKVALELERNAIGYEINPDFLEVINKKLNTINNSFLYKIETIKKEIETPEIKAVKYEPRIKDASPIIDPKIIEPKKNQYFKVSEIVSADTVKLNSGLEVKLLGVKIKKEKEKEAVEYLKNYVLNKEVFLRYDSNSTVKNNNVNAYLYLKNKIFINAYLIKSGLALADKDSFYTYKNKFEKLERID
jgi:hypothetical protein